MYHKCTWCKARITFQPIYYTQGFLQLSPGFGVYCNAACSLSAHEAKSGSHIKEYIHPPELQTVDSL